MRRFLFWLALGFATCFVWGSYILALPVTVQTGDTAELIAAAKNLFISHPPGYPLYIWIQHGFIEATSFGSVFYRASFLNSFFAVLSLGLLVWTLKEKIYLSVSFVLLLAFSRIFWRYAELPDVFALNALFASAIVALYFYDDGVRSVTLLLPFLFSLGLTNHHTLLFLAPIAVDVLWRRRQDWRVFASLGLGVAAFAGLYASMIWMNPESFYSWADLRTLPQLMGHLLRKDYGTFRLVSSTLESSVWQNWWLLAKESFLSFYPLFLAVVTFALLRKRLRWDRKDLMVLGCLSLYALVFFPLANAAQVGIQIEVFERFMILFQVLLVFSIGRFLMQIRTSRLVETFFGVVILIVAGSKYLLWRGENDFSKNRVVEDYVVNMLNQVRPGVPTVVIMNGDTRYFAARYVQTVLNVQPEATVITPKTFFFDSLAQKLLLRTGLRVDIARMQKERSADLEQDLILPNIARFDFLTHLIFLEKASYQLTILPLGRRISAGAGVQIDNSYYDTLRMQTDVTELRSDPRNYDAFRELLSDYALSPLIQAKNLEQVGKPDAALAMYQQTLRNVPWAWPAAAEACRLGPACDQSLLEVKNKYFDYYR